MYKANGQNKFIFLYEWNWKPAILPSSRHEQNALVFKENAEIARERPSLEYF